ncbi:hypothetical protein FOL47_004951 [Perkinsus chesapeaki]|uniref:Uncharacterized protein n=1 Tax=Perkinsus chesapeaki TaxID=330153 RepID=A0A7J6MZY8_PERCH|nr:hypothetical protein FOL47_004951 [Perkinsus chesapeaki]
MVNAIHLTITTINSLGIVHSYNAGGDVAVTSQGWVVPPKYSCQVFTIGVNRFVLEGATLLDDGSIFDDDFRNNITAASEITDCAKKSRARPSVALYTKDYPFDKCTPEGLNYTEFRDQAQALVTNYGEEEVLFRIWAGNFQESSWQMARNISNVIRHHLRTTSGKRASASLGFAAEPVYAPLWGYIERAHVGLFDARDIGISFTRGIIDHLTTLGVSRSQVRLSIETSGFLLSTLMPMAYNKLIRKGVPYFGDGHFEGSVYHSQKQVHEKVELIKDERLKGFSLSHILSDLPFNDTRSLLDAALYHS